ncbi:MAG TPA: hypothetical protein VFQ68_25535 [Streptosporangiaceae bacterium]|nr:hypothetical protein [Streptosporangiaceae bacterium]
MIFQFFNLLDDVTAADNVPLPARWGSITGLRLGGLAGWDGR